MSESRRSCPRQTGFRKTGRAAVELFFEFEWGFYALSASKAKEPVNIVGLDINSGQAHLLHSALDKLGNPAFAPPGPGETQDATWPPRPNDDGADLGEIPLAQEGTGNNSQEEILRAEEVLDRLLKDPATSLSLGSGGPVGTNGDTVGRPTPPVAQGLPGQGFYI